MSDGKVCSILRLGLNAASTKELLNERTRISKAQRLNKLSLASQSQLDHLGTAVPWLASGSFSTRDMYMPRQLIA